MKIQKKDGFHKRIYGVVYEPNVIDSHGDMMTKEDVEHAAHSFLRVASLGEAIDTHHDNWPNGSYPVESFIARKGDTEYPEGAWVIGVQVTDDELWEQVVKGEIAGFSFEGKARKVAVEVEVEYAPTYIGMTEPDPEDGHVHFFVAKLDENGKVSGGNTSTVNGHSHLITKATATDKAKGHHHRYFIT